MHCPSCGNAIASDDRFCGICGAPLHGITDETQQVEAVDATGSDGDIDADWGDDDPVWAATGQVPVGSGRSTLTTDSLPRTEPITEVWTRTEPPPAGTSTTVVDTTTVMPTQTAEMSVVPTPIRERERFRPGAVTLLSVLGAIVMLVGTFTTIVSVASNTPIVPSPDSPLAFRTGQWIADDLAGNLSIGVLIAVGFMVAGGVAAGFGWRGGAGLAAGAGLAVAGLAALTIGLAQIPIDAAFEMARIPSEQEFTLTITRDLGYWLQLGGAAIGVIVFFAAINDAFGDRRNGLNPWIAALGALASIVFAAGPLIPTGQAVISDNWYVNDAPGSVPAMLLTGRLIQLALIAFTGVVGFLSVRRWGLGLALGGTFPAIWLVVSTVFDLDRRPVGPGYANPGSGTITLQDITVHGVTIIGASAVFAFGALAVAAAYDQSRHEW